MAIMPIMLVVLTACGTGGGPSTAGSDAAAPLTAEQVTSVLIGKIPTVKLVKAYTATDDPNHQLGRPNGYTSKTAFSDSRVPAGELEGQREDATERGGSVEVFADAASAKARMDYIQTIGKSLPLAVEYNYVNGPILVRVTNLLTPDQAKDYETATKELR
jgi:hypothetical protein